MKVLQVCLMLELSATTLCATEMAAQRPEAGPNSHAMHQASDDSVGAATCAACHKDVVKNFADNPHGRQTHVHLGKGVTCESCHGPSKTHVENGAVTPNFDLARATAKDADEMCEKCHEARRAHFEHSVHGKGNVSCIGCHSVHSARASRQLLKMEQPQLCFQCHSDVKPQFSLAVHHKVEEGLINCTDCHDAHGASEENMVPSSTWQFIVCTKCHVPTAGPFVYEHAAVKAEGCTACHFAHGGPNPELLLQASVNTICLYCHFPSSNSKTAALAVPEHVQTAGSQSCTGCHASIHGSDVSDVFSKSTREKSEP